MGAETKKRAAPTLREILAKSTSYLEDKGSPTARLDAELLLSEALGIDRVQLYVNFDQPLVKEELDRCRELVRRRGRGEPVAYILGRAWFRDLELEVDPSVLVPRPETELLVEAALSFLESRSWQQPPAVLELGTGSGAVALAVAAAYPAAAVTATDVSREALALAERNARRAGVGGRVRLVESDLFAALDPGAPFDAVLANPPYIADHEWQELPGDVRRYEPAVALRGGADGLDCYRRLVPAAPRYLRPGGLLALEIGWRQGDAVRGLLRETGAFSGIEVRPDLAGHPRLVTAVKG